MFGSFGLIGLSGMLAQAELLEREQHVRAVWITGGTLPTSPTGPSDSISGFISTVPELSHPTIKASTLHLKGIPLCNDDRELILLLQILIKHNLVFEFQSI